ncbi:Uu.00g085920.m01.CDS01 [Anthostomella pinea]|uniref:Uu.00g085920.m01.CDS01 n=1 Tax=Anthostomella pinea TaxID=933095 RepID=A0AAI8VMZ7_9PEZI|nr:Uu.00g085920.m01.CDS01 [Anthostomella pinea]
MESAIDMSCDQIRCTGDRSGCSRPRTPETSIDPTILDGTRSLSEQKNATQLQGERKQPHRDGRSKKNRRQQDRCANGKSQSQPSTRGSISVSETTQHQPPALTPSQTSGSAASSAPTPTGIVEFELSGTYAQTELGEDSGMADVSDFSLAADVDWEQGLGDGGMFLKDTDSNGALASDLADTSMAPLDLEQWLSSSPIMNGAAELDHCVDLLPETSLFSFSKSQTPAEMSSITPSANAARSCLARHADIDITTLPGFGGGSGEDPSVSRPNPEEMVTAARGDSQASGGCKCLQRIVILIDEMDLRIAATPADHVGNLDWELWSHKDAVKHGESMFACRMCSTRVENMMLLSFLTDRLALLCERIVRTYSELRLGQVRVAMGKSMGLSYKAIRFGDYEVDSPAEWEMILKPLIVLQLKALKALVDKVELSKRAQRKSSRATKDKVRGLIEIMGS